MRTSVIACLCALLAGAASKDDSVPVSIKTDSGDLDGANIDWSFRPDWFSVTCRADGVLDARSQARLPRLKRFMNVAVRRCEPPAGLSYVAALRALNIEIDEEFQIVNSTADRLLPRTLEGANSLKRFYATYNKFTTLPADLFEYTPDVFSVDLRNNRLETLPSDLFSGLRGLLFVWLDDNRLTASELRVLAPATGLQTLHLSGNPIGNHCPGESGSVLSKLKELTTLRLAKTNATYFCGWIFGLRKLKYLYLEDNQIQHISCKALAGGNAFFVEKSLISLDNNPISADCTWEDFLCPFDGPGPKPSGELVVDLPTTCECGLYWLVKAMAARNVRVVFEVDYRPEPCQTEWLDCEDDL